MKTFILSLLIMFSAQMIFSQKIVLHRSTSGNLTYELNTVDSITFLPFVCGEDILYEGKTYGTVSIANQCWLKENLDVGTMINSTTHSTNNSIIEKYCYNNNPANCTTYGGLYQWQEAMQYVTTEGARGICPEGWHIPTQAEFAALSTFVGGDGNSLKAIDQGTGAGQGTDLYGFSALLAGNKETNHIFLDIGRIGHFWSSTSSNTNVPHYYLWNDRSDFTQHWGVYSTYGFSVRCIKDN